MSDTGGRSKTLRVFSLFGHIGAGKTTVAKAICRLIPGARKMSYADRLKNGVCAMFDCSRADLDDPDFKKTEAIPGVTYRRLMQTLGTEWGRDTIQKSMWASLACRDAVHCNHDNIVFDDGRFPDTECLMMEELLHNWNDGRYEKIEFYPILIDRPDLDADLSHASEAALKEYAFAYTFFNRTLSTHNIKKSVETFFKFKMKLEDFQ